MDYIIHCRGDQRIFPVPNGLYELTADITREVLRSQPKDIYDFIIEYLSAQLKARKVAVAAVEVVNDLIIDGKPFIKYLSDRGLTLEQANHAATTIQIYWGKYQNKKKTKKVVEEDMEAERDTDIDQDTQRILKWNKITYSQAELYASRIQAAFKGYLTRKALTKAISKELSHTSWDHDWLWKRFESDECFDKDKSEIIEKAEHKVLKYLPNRNIPINKMDLRNMLCGFYEDYERESPPKEVYEGLRTTDRSKVLKRPSFMSTDVSGAEESETVDSLSSEEEEEKPEYIKPWEPTYAEIDEEWKIEVLSESFGEEFEGKLIEDEKVLDEDLKEDGEMEREIDGEIDKFITEQYEVDEEIREIYGENDISAYYDEEE